MQRTASNQLHQEALAHLVGGVNSPVRAFKSVHGDPIYFKRASGAIVTDADGNELVDFVQSWGPLIHGHAHPEILANVFEKMKNGTSFGAPHLGEIELAKHVKKRFSHMDKVRFVSSGTEAVMSAVRLARGFLQRLRTLCDEHGSLLIFDEVISGFRFKDGSYGDLCGVQPDLTALGKVIGGGLPVGAYGARNEIMNHLSPIGPVYQAGTLSGYPLAMAAGLTTLEMLDDAAYDYLEELGSLLQASVEPVLERHGHPMQFVRLGSLFWFSPGDQSPPSRADQIPSDAGKLYADVHHGLLERGYMLAPSAYEIGFLATAHKEEHVKGMAQALDDVLTNLGLSS